MIIQFGIVNKKYLLILLCPAFLAATRILYNQNEEINNNSFLLIFINLLSLTFCGFIHLINKVFSKSKRHKKKHSLLKKVELNNKEIENNFKDISLKEQIIKKNEIKKRKELKLQKKNSMFYILLLSFIQMFASFIQKIFKKDTNLFLSHSILVLLELIFLIIFSMIFLNYSLYLHQLVSFGILFFCHIIFFIQSIKNLKNLTVISIFKSFLYFYSYEQLYCLYNVIGKKYLNLYMDGIYLFLFKIGIIWLIPLLLYDIIAYLSGLDNKYHGIIFGILNNFDILDFIIKLFNSLVLHIGLWLTINYFSPCHFIILYILDNFLEIIILLIKKKDIIFSREQIITICILYPILILDVLVFNEVIILNFWGLNTNTKYYIMKREKTDNRFSLGSINSYYYEQNEEDEKKEEEFEYNLLNEEDSKLY